MMDEAPSDAHVAALKSGMKQPPAAQGDTGDDEGDEEMLASICDALEGLASQPGTDPKMASALSQACSLIAPFASTGNSDSGEEQAEGEQPPAGTDDGENG